MCAEQTSPQEPPGVLPSHYHPFLSKDNQHPDFKWQTCIFHPFELYISGVTALTYFCVCLRITFLRFIDTGKGGSCLSLLVAVAYPLYEYATIHLVHLLPMDDFPILGYYKCCCYSHYFISPLAGKNVCLSVVCLTKSATSGSLYVCIHL